MTIDNDEFHNILRSATILYADGIAIVKTLKKKGVNSARIPGCDLWVELMHDAARTDKHVYLLGAKEEVNRKAAEKLRGEFNLKKLNRKNGYFKEESEIARDLQNLRPDIVTVAMGSPQQEKLIARLREVYPEAFYMGVGGSYDVFVGEAKRAPEVFQRLNLEWLYRLLSEPKRIFRQFILVKYAYMHLTNRL
ncbi:WecB/TagA/CpsF family glycosyltransferase [Kangiella shandongensis]|uniref:WecB/TagA/CpsF family glycosyltransferase n=1 Tax=Kangiella shandongensis TaxID=2763258 RepID=UPI001CBCD554|nr:WecB/TagA/CpsF family glycosyltransferase [Kangiella shandongensis]